MTIFRKPIINALFITFFSCIYCLLFSIPADHIEFYRLMNKQQTIDNTFWNFCFRLIREGNARYISMLFGVLTVSIIILSVIKRKKFDEYQFKGLIHSLMYCGLLSILLIPITLLSILSDRNYAIEIIYVIATIDWLTILLVDLFHLIKKN